MVKTILLVLFSCLTVALARDETSSCRDVTRQTCQGFQSCCARKCGGPHQTSCSEAGGRISQASCECEGRGSTSSSVHHVQGLDHSNICRLAAEGSCSSFRSCCANKCVNPIRLSCSSSGSSLTNTVCQCPSMSSGGSGHFQHTTARSGSSHGGSGGLRETAGEEDFTHTCTRNYHDCTSFRSCCTNRCSGRNVQAQCQESGRTLKNTLCKCGRAFIGI
jgi:hypothetical protein